MPPPVNLVSVGVAHRASQERRHRVPPPLTMAPAHAQAKSYSAAAKRIPLVKGVNEPDGTELAELQEEMVSGALTPKHAVRAESTLIGDHYAAHVIHFAAQDGHATIVRAQLDEGVYPNLATERRGWTPLHYAAYNGRQEVAELLLRRGARPECRSLSDMTPMHLALQAKHADVASLLADAVCEAARPKPRWVRSWETAGCMRCTAAFSLLAPKHHCRYCGCTVCGDCSAGRLVLDRYLAPRKPHEVRHTSSETPQRVCDGCLRCYPQHVPEASDSEAEAAAAAEDDQRLLRALTTWNPALAGWASLEPDDGTKLLELQPAGLEGKRAYGEWDCTNGRGFGRIYKVVSDARLRAEVGLASELVGVLRVGQSFTALETRVVPGSGPGKTRVSLPLTNQAVQLDKGASQLGASFSAELAKEFVKAHSAYVAHTTDEHSLAVGDLIVVTDENTNLNFAREHLRKGWAKGFKLVDGERVELMFPLTHTKPIKLKLAAV